MDSLKYKTNNRRCYAKEHLHSGTEVVTPLLLYVPLSQRKCPEVKPPYKMAFFRYLCEAGVKVWHYVSMDVAESAEGESLILCKEGVEPADRFRRRLWLQKSQKVQRIKGPWFDASLVNIQC